MARIGILNIPNSIPLQSHQAKGQWFLELSKVTYRQYAVTEPAARYSSPSVLQLQQ
jgi:hypothetical protein